MQSFTKCVKRAGANIAENNANGANGERRDRVLV